MVEYPYTSKACPTCLSHATGRGLLSFHTSNKEAVHGAGFVFLALPTPEGEDGRADLKYVHAVVDELANEVGEDTIFVVKSTVPPGTVASLRKRLADLGSSARIVSHPEFLRRGEGGGRLPRARPNRGWRLGRGRCKGCG